MDSAITADAKNATFDITTFDASHLKGVVNTNDNPLRCAVCAKYFTTGEGINKRSLSSSFFLTSCCGKAACVDCDPVLGDSCPFCHGNRRKFGALKKQAKRGSPWAQTNLARAYANGTGVTKSGFDALRWHRRAATFGHPYSILMVGRRYIQGTVCDQDLAKAMDLSLQARELDPSLTEQVKRNLHAISSRYEDQGYIVEAERILRPLSDGGDPESCYRLAFILSSASKLSESFETKDRVHLSRSADALKLFAISACTHEDKMMRYASCYGAMCCCIDLQNWSQARIWVHLVSKPRGDFRTFREENVDRIAVISSYVKNALRDLRRSCAECSTSLNISNRQLCKQCKTSCYCSRACQKKHWNRKDGHRDECMEVLDLKKKMKAVMAINNST